jgi:uncharacterized phage protein (TIGR01671 family)
MNREIKFKTWLLSLNKMTATRTLSEMLNGFGFAMGNDIRLQYIGLKDMHQNEIYEGDIVKQPSEIFGEQEKIGQVKFINGCFKILFGYDECTGEWDSDCFVDMNTVVIGNVFENPNLLTNA